MNRCNNKKLGPLLPIKTMISSTKHQISENLFYQMVCHLCTRDTLLHISIHTTAHAARTVSTKPLSSCLQIGLTIFQTCSAFWQFSRNMIVTLVVCSSRTATTDSLKKKKIISQCNVRACNKLYKNTSIFSSLIRVMS